MQPARFVLRHEDEADTILARLGQFDALARHLGLEEAMRDLHEHARAVTHQRIGADGPAMLQIVEDRQTLFDDRVGLHILHMRDEADAAGIVLLGRVVETLRGRERSGFDGRDLSVRGLHGLALDHGWRRRHRVTSPYLEPRPEGGFQLRAGHEARPV